MTSKALLSVVWLAVLAAVRGEALDTRRIPKGGQEEERGRRSDDKNSIMLEEQKQSEHQGQTSIHPTPLRAKLLDDSSLLDVTDDTGFRMRDYGVQIYERPAVWGHPHLGSLMVYRVKERSDAPCGMLMAKVIYAIKYAMAKKFRNHKFVTEPEVQLFTELGDAEDGREVLDHTMKVLGNYTLADGIQSGSVWKIDDQNNYISCEQNLQQRLEEHTINHLGDALYQGDMASVGAHCQFGEQSQKRGSEGFPVGTMGCKGWSMCQFSHSDEAVHFCSLQSDCIAIEGRIDPSGCEAGMGCYVPKKGEMQMDTEWQGLYGGKTYIKHCPGALTQLEDAVKSGRRMAGDRWEGGQISFCFGDGLSEAAQEAVFAAVEQIQRQVPCIRLDYTHRANSTTCQVTPSIMFTSARGDGCWSYVGQVSGKTEGWEHKSQAINLDRGCELPGIVLHELGHALGMVHQQSRGDRNDHLSMHWGNVTSGNEVQFKKSSDAQKWGFTGFDMCDGKAGQAKLLMETQDCLDIQGLPNRDAANAADYQTTEDGFRTCSSCSCTVDICEDAKYMFAPPNSCQQKVSSGGMEMKVRDCAAARGVVEGAGHADDDWVKCEFDVCTDAGYLWSKPFACNNKIGAGYLSVRKPDCQDMEGGMNLAHDDAAQYIQCHFDLCSGEVDTPFDWTSLMMYSPYQFSKKPSMQTGDLTSEPKGHRRLLDVLGQRMSLSSFDVFHLGHMYNCWDQIQPDMPLSQARAIIDKMESGEFFEYGRRRVCEDVTPEHTGFDVESDAGFMRHASCEDLAQYCHNGTIGQAVRTSCPVSCFVCMPQNGETSNGLGTNGPCFDASQTGIRFRDGPKASCQDLINYCNHTTIGTQVRTACPLSCGMCEIHVEGPYLDQYGNCVDLQTHEEPEFTVAGNLAGCSDLRQFCQNHPDSYLIRHKCPSTCGVCGAYSPPPPPAPSMETKLPFDMPGCERRRRYGFCSTRRRRNL